MHTCLICKGKDSSGRMDREANNLSFRDPKKMFMHYGKHLYDEGRLFKHIPPVGGSAEGFDEYGRVYRYKCGFKGCWKATKKDCGYKEYALHMVTDHDKLGDILEGDERPDLVKLFAKVQKMKAQRLEADRPLHCLVPGCPDADQLHSKERSYRTLLAHYASAHWRPWFDQLPPAQGERPRRQRLTQLGAECDLCKEKLYGDDKKMVEHYATDHNKLEEAIVDPKSVPISTEVTRAVLEQLFPDLLIFV